MARKKVTEAPTLAQKVKVLGKLYDSGCKTEQALHALSIEAILNIEGITIQDMSIIMEIQKRAKSRALFSYLGGDENEQPEENN